jgi:hypothetical protein
MLRSIAVYYANGIKGSIELLIGTVLICHPIRTPVTTIIVLISITLVRLQCA